MPDEAREWLITILENRFSESGASSNFLRNTIRGVLNGQ